MKNPIQRFVTLFCFALSATALQAATYDNKYWDIDGSTPGAGGTAPVGNWIVGGGNWTDDSTGASAGTTWTNNAIAVFSAGGDASGAFTVTLTGPVIAHGVTVEEGTVTITGTSANNMTSPDATGCIFTIPSGLTANIAARLRAAQNNPYFKRGEGTVVLTGNSDFASALQIEAGTVSVATINAANATGPLGSGIGVGKEVSLGTTSGGIGTLRYTGGTATINVNRRFQIKSGGTGVFQIDGAAVTVTIQGPITNSTTADANGLVKKTGAGTLKLTYGGNTYGNLTISEGRVQASVVANGGTASPMGKGTTVTIEGGSTSIFSYTGTAASMDRGFVLGSGGGTIESTADVLTLTGGITSSPADQPLTIAGAGSVTITNTALNIGTGDLTMNGAGVLTLSTANTYGATIINSGTLEAAASGSIPTNATVGAIAVFKLSSATAMASGATLTLDSSPSANTVDLNFSGTQTINTLYFGTTQKAAGTWGAIGSGAAHENAAFTGTGMLNVSSGPASATALVSSADPAVYGALVLTATVTSTSGTPYGTVTFKEGANVLGTAPLVSGVATLNPGNTLPPGGPYSLTAEYAGNDDFGPSTSSSLSQTVTTGALMIKADDKTKDYSDTAALAFTPIGLAPGDTVGSATLTCSQAADTTAIPGAYDIVPSAATGGTFNPAYYSITYSNGTLTVNKAALSIRADDKSKPYGGTVALTFTPTGLKNGETVGSATLTCSEASDPTAPIGAYTISASAATGGTFNPNNYDLSYASGTLTVNPAELTVTGIEAADKVYDGTTNATLNVTNALLLGAVNADVLSLETTNATGAFTNKTVGVSKTVRISGLEVYGDRATNYTLIQPTTNASITLRTLTVTAAGINRSYNGTTNATVNLSDDKLAGDTVTDSYTSAYFADKNVGTAKPVAVEGISISGADAGNYSLASTTASTTADIMLGTPLTVTGLSAQNKVYDGGTNATLSGTAGLSGAVGGDEVWLEISSSVAAAFVTKTVGTGKTVNVTGLSLAGADAGNYSLTPLALTADITPAALTVTGLAAQNKVYDGGTNATLAGTAGLSGVLGSDAVSLTGTASGAFTDANVGTAKTVTVTGLSLTGADADNYGLTPLVLTADITAASSTTALLSSLNPSTNGDLVTFTATVTGPGAPTGDVVFKTNTVPFSTNTLVSGSASASTAALPVGTHTVTAEYAAQANWLGSSASLDQVVKSAVVYSQTNYILSIADLGAGSYTLYFQGTEGARYYVVTSSDAAAAMNTWTVVGTTNTAGSGGLWSATVSGAAPAYYRGAAVDPQP